MTAEPRGAEREPDDFNVDDPACWFADADAIRADDPLAASLLAAIGRQVQAEREAALCQLVEQSSPDLNGTYRYAITGSTVVVSDGADWSQKTVTLLDGYSKTETSITIVQAIQKGWYVRIDPATQPIEGGT